MTAGPARDISRAGPAVVRACVRAPEGAYGGYWAPGRTRPLS